MGHKNITVIYQLLTVNFVNYSEMVPTADVAIAFKDVDAAFMVGSMPRREGMERKELLSANVKIFKAQVCRWFLLHSCRVTL